MESAVATAERQRQVNVHTSALVRLGDAYRHLGRLGNAMSIAERALEQARRRGERGTEARALRLLASSSHRDGLNEAETHYRSALALADELEMRPQRALCQLGLGALYRVHGRADEARELLRAAEAEAIRLGLSSATAEAAQELAVLG
jgi:tetratricopeptide (TPR) repeat protein